MTPKTCLPSLPPVNTALQINCVASPFWETELLSKLSSDRTCEYYCKCTHAMLEPAIVFLSESLSPLCCLCSTTVSGYIKHTYAHFFTECITLSLPRCLQPINIHLSGTSLALSLVLHNRCSKVSVHPLLLI